MQYSAVQTDPAENRAAILGVWERHYPGVMPPRYDWLYLHNPAGRAQAWLLRHEPSGQWVGTTALFPREFVLDGRPARAGIAGNLLVDAGHRTAGPALVLQRAVVAAVRAGVVDFAYGFPNAASEPVMKRAGWRPLGPRVRFVRLLRAGSRLRALPFGRYWSAGAGPVADLALRVADLPLLLRRDREVVVRELAPSDPCAGLSDGASAAPGVVAARSDAYVRWRFLECPGGSERVLVGTRAGGHAGYLAYRARGAVVEIRDFSPAVGSRVLAALFHRLTVACRHLSAERLVVAGLDSAALAGALEPLGFIRRPDEHRVYAVAGDGSMSRWPDLSRPERWFLLQGDDDA